MSKNKIFSGEPPKNPVSYDEWWANYQSEKTKERMEQMRAHDRTYRAQRMEKRRQFAKDVSGFGRAESNEEKYENFKQMYEMVKHLGTDKQRGYYLSEDMDAYALADLLVEISQKEDFSGYFTRSNFRKAMDIYIQDAESLD